MRSTKVFSIKDGGLVIEDSIIELYDNSYMIASTLPNVSDNEDIYLLPSTLIRTPKSDDELAEEYIKENFPKFIVPKTLEDIFLAGRKSFGDKKYHLSEEDIQEIIDLSRTGERDPFMGNGIDYKYTDNDIIASLTPPIYPTKITVEHDGDNYLWETLKASYE